MTWPKRASRRRARDAQSVRLRLANVTRHHSLDVRRESPNSSTDGVGSATCRGSGGEAARTSRRSHTRAPAARRRLKSFRLATQRASSVLTTSRSSFRCSRCSRNACFTFGGDACSVVDGGGLRSSRAIARGVLWAGVPALSPSMCPEVPGQSRQQISELAGVRTSASDPGRGLATHRAMHQPVANLAKGAGLRSGLGF